MEFSSLKNYATKRALEAILSSRQTYWKKVCASFVYTDIPQAKQKNN
jgi:hypothetical protein